MTDAEVYREEFAHEPYSFWLDGWRGQSYMGCGVPAEYDGAGQFVGWITYEGEWRFIRVERMLVRSATPPVWTDRAASPASKLSHLAIPRARYLEAVEKCLEWIRAGETYEICLTNKIFLITDLTALEYYERLRATNPAPYAAFLNFGDTQIACTSPECFLRIDANGNVESSPIKGTLPSRQDPDELLTNKRFRAENLMIVDLVRNDLSRVCKVGSVHVPELMKVETYPTVHQLVSTITGQLRQDVTPVDCIRAAFPGGSMTGAPKIRTMELLRQLEPEPRGIYSGSVGYLNFDGVSDLNIVIRTAIFRGGEVSIGVGGAIVAHSDPVAEWEETMLKARALLDAFDPELRRDVRLL